MKAIDVVLPEPKTNLEVHKRWKNNFVARFIAESSFSTTIEVTDGKD